MHKSHWTGQSTMVIYVGHTVDCPHPSAVWMGAVNNGDLCRTHYGLHGWEQSTMVIYVGHTMVCMDGQQCVNNCCAPIHADVGHTMVCMDGSSQQW